LLSGIEIDLPNLNSEPVFVAIPEVFLPMLNIHAHKRNVHPVLLHQVSAVLTIFVIVPVVIVAMLTIVIASVTVMVVSHCRNWGNQGGSGQERAEN
jgi:predicted branched-subunit amino acid permease